ncbi:hypothetical protein [Fimbriimonas ginsengisoli]|uniref:Uncharacterized protein n=1 Tax=Fimbriimonas ginsengisoli Gsoil 348 TaxID=661478 RepID=A0A068NLQ3_FIMGI|nr:hypothetical protein [Fimbriimonas ginsengisoli]AIE84483.1 hypothetical protein OP10G_1115 [Fimbriimonas ginsengisoli Gsoil 348]
MFSLIALALAFLSFIAFRGRGPAPARPEAVRIGALVAITALSCILASRYGPSEDSGGVVAGLVIGAVVALGGELFGGIVAPLAVGVAGAAALHFLKTPLISSAQLALICGVGLGTLALGIEGAVIASLAAAVCAAADGLGALHANAPAAAVVGTMVGLGAVVGTFLAMYVPDRLIALKPVVIGAVTVAGAFFATRPLSETAMLVAVGLGALAGVVVYFVLPEEEADAVRIGLSTVIAIGVATIAFGLAKGAGMALALVTMAAVLLGSNHRRAFLTVGPLVGLVLYRLLREQHPDLSRALDIGQHYAMLGVALGAVVPLLPSDWLSRRGWRGAAGAFLWSVLALGFPALVVVMLGGKGAVGFVAGLGLSGLCQALRRERSLMPLAVAAGLSATTVALLGWLRDSADLSRDEKVHLFAYTGGGLVVIAALLALVSRPAKVEVAS